MSQQERGDQRDAYEAVFTALAHPVRRRILLTVYFKGGSMTAGEIASMFEQAWPTTTRHLQVLESAGLLRHQRTMRFLSRSAPILLRRRSARQDHAPVHPRCCGPGGLRPEL